MRLGVACHGDIEVVAVLGADVADEIDTIGKTTLNGFPFLADRWVTAESKDVPAAMLFGFL